MKQVDWARVEDIEFSARKIFKDNPTVLKECTAKTMLFLCDTIKILRDQNQTLRERLKSPNDLRSG